MKQVKLEIFLTQEDKEKDSVIDLLVRESGNTRSQVIQSLQVRDVVVVPLLPESHAERLVGEFRIIGVMAKITEPDPEALKENESQEVVLRESETFQHSWNWWAFIFTYLWYFFKGLWAKFAFYAILQTIINRLPIHFLLIILYNLCFWIYVGKRANYDLYLKQELSEKFWPKYPYKKWKKLFIVGCILFFLGGIIYPMVRTAQVGIGALNQFMESGSDFESTHVKISENITFLRVPKTWWKNPNPGPGLNVKVSRQVGNGELKIEYETTKNTRMAALLGTTPLFSGLDNESLGVVAIELFEPSFFKKYPGVEDEKVIQEIMKRARVDFPLFFGWLDKFFKVRGDEPVYKNLANYRWGRVGVTKEIELFGNSFQTLGDIFWTVVGDDLLLFYCDYFPEYRTRVRREVEGVLLSMQVKGEKIPPLPLDTQSIEPQNTNLTSLSESKEGDSVRSIIAKGEEALTNGNTEAAERYLEEAIQAVQSDRDLEPIERLRSKLGY